MKSKWVSLATLALVGLSGCGFAADPSSEDSAGGAANEESPNQAVEETPVYEEPEYQPVTPEPQQVSTIPLGTPLVLGEAEITVNGVEQYDEIVGEYKTLTPGEGESLHQISMNWTNTADEAVSKVCHGPHSVNLRVYDAQDREMLQSNDSGFIPGNDCSDGLMTGQSGEWHSAFLGLKGAEVAYMVFEDYTNTGGGPPQVVAIQEGLELTWTPG